MSYLSWNDWCQIIRSLIQYFADGVTLEEFAATMSSLGDLTVPYRSFNFQTLEDMLHKIPGLKLVYTNGRLVITAVMSENMCRHDRLHTTPHYVPLLRRNRITPPANNRPEQQPESNNPRRFRVAGNSYSSLFATVRARRKLNLLSPTRMAPSLQINRTISFYQRLRESTLSIPNELTPTPIILEQQRLISEANMDDPRLRLFNYTHARGLPEPVYGQIFVNNDDNVYASAEVDKLKYHSYPHEAKTIEEAEKVAAKKALSLLTIEETNPQVTTEDSSLILGRVLEIVESYPNGIFKSYVEEIYGKKYIEALPKNWLEIIEHEAIIVIGGNNEPKLSPL
ncbi:hypothetical protein TSAR_011136 [Trichomalopsis sarcophagae]|uniref:HTH OST-type domain-containing protein n=1 Tax=Trichomalopsis sarcophagae TaxID=543379 RepID=A0A232FH90_9HYME|nr:hypothetical protein TSAR_011136 [Trichomalopsis sarcophagae]